MTVSRLWVERYRSLVNLGIDLYPVTVIQGENATGKTNLGLPSVDASTTPFSLDECAAGASISRSQQAQMRLLAHRDQEYARRYLPTMDATSPQHWPPSTTKPETSLHGSLIEPLARRGDRRCDRRYDWVGFGAYAAQIPPSVARGPGLMRRWMVSVSSQLFQSVQLRLSSRSLSVPPQSRD